MKLPDWITARPIAHRGLFDNTRGIPENSLTAVRAAVEAGYAMELDLQAIAGGVAVFHDSRLERMTGSPVAIARLAPSELMRLRLAGSNEGIPLLEDVLTLVKGRVPLMLEIKNDGRPGAFEELVLAKLADYRGDIAIVSFNPFSLRFIGGRAPHIPRGQTAASFKYSDLPRWRRVLQRNFLLNAVSRPDFLLYELDGLPNWAVAWRRSLGAKVVAYTVRSAADAEKAKLLADNFIFEGMRP
jgi:glycerophosphoryl diester phosphodiesterase